MPRGTTPPADFQVWPAVQTFLGIAFILATLFTLFTPANLFSTQWVDQMIAAWNAPVQTTPIAGIEPNKPVIRVGIVAGHSGDQNDPGAVCEPPLDNRMTEAQINLMIAQKVVALLEKEGYSVDLLTEMDKRLPEYQANVLVSIHTDSCAFINNEATGFKVADGANALYPQLAQRLKNCLISRYAKATKLPVHPGSVTDDMTRYHAFDEIDTNTTAAIIEIGFMNLDYNFLINNADLVAQGIADGINCFVRNESIDNLPPTQ